ncbi:MAG TPA: TetR/AcrR family transcriptional regulator [Rhizomicrobium sp.]|nr:TetR/AcrR family transcriptional regulator [Rhizomicrobium sp.]
MRTGRPRNFSTEAALDRAMTVFWQKGYEGASLADLTEAMEINPPSLYAAFGNKEGLFRAVLERYDARRKELMDRVLTAPDAISVARTFLHGVAEFAADTSGRNPPGCLLVQSGLSCSEEFIPEVLAQHRAEKERALRERFERDRRERKLPASAEPATLARYLVAMANGLAVQAAAGASAAELREVADLALAAWPVDSKEPEKATS